jgi:hypothetical protein
MSGLKNNRMKPTKLGKVERTSRGFEVVNFTDHYGTKCSIQAGSLAIYAKPGTSAVWLGVDDVEPKVMASQAARFGIKTEKTTGWIPYPIPPDVSLATRMHLNREQVEALIQTLQSWLKRDTFKLKTGK